MFVNVYLENQSITVEDVANPSVDPARKENREND